MYLFETMTFPNRIPVVHRPVLDVEACIQYMCRRDNINNLRYVMTTELHVSNVEMDVYYRYTPHPQFGNRYFGLMNDGNHTQYICNADAIEGMDFTAIKASGKLYYSPSKHACVSAIDGVESFYEGNDFVNYKFIDGGRSYARSNARPHILTVESGKLIEHYQPVGER